MTSKMTKQAKRVQAAKLFASDLLRNIEPFLSDTAGAFGAFMRNGIFVAAAPPRLILSLTLDASDKETGGLWVGFNKLTGIEKYSMSMVAAGDQGLFSSAEVTALENRIRADAGER
jgi:hypothetical protein